MAAIQALINGIGGLGRFVQLLPSSPFQNLQAVIGENQFIAAVLWIVPAGQALALMQAWLAAILIYYAVKVPLRWAQVVKG
jgi:hypothetical protein